MRLEPVVVGFRVGFGAGDGYGDGFRLGDVGREVGGREMVGLVGVEDGWGAEFGAGEVVRAAWDGEEGGGGEGGEEWGPGREFVGVVGDDECTRGKEAVVPDWGVGFVVVVDERWD